jgi:hypothetical protein
MGPERGGSASTVLPDLKCGQFPPEETGDLLACRSALLFKYRRRMAVEQHRNISKAQIICQAAPARLTIASPSDSPAAFAHQGFGTRDHSQPHMPNWNTPSSQVEESKNGKRGHCI